jgi:inosine-uridine nucleoside N-ribohydrolase
MHDASAVIYLVEPDAFTCISGAACVATAGVALGQMILDRKGGDYFLDDWAQRTSVSVTMQVDASRVRQSFVATISTGF